MRVSEPHRWPPRFLVVVAALGLAVAACADDDAVSTTADTASVDAAASTTANTGASPSTADASFPVTIEHAYGSTVVEDRPERIVSLGTQWTDVLLAMGVQPVAYLHDPLAGETGRFPWQDDLSADSTAIEVSGAALPFEQIAALDPDLILVTFLVEDRGDYADLAAIAPTIGPLGERQVDTWQGLTEVAGQMLDDPGGAADVIAGADELMASTAAELPGLAGKTFVLANYVPGDQLYVVADEADGSSVFFQDLGMQLDPEILAEADGAAGRVELSLEQAGMLDSDVLVLFANDGDPADLVGYEQLPAVQGGSVADLDYAAVVGLNTPSPLSIPYSRDLVLRALQAAAAAPTN
jgi:iron complex transport system substrate-binding protein